MYWVACEVIAWLRSLPYGPALGVDEVDGPLGEGGWSKVNGPALLELRSWELDRVAATFSISRGLVLRLLKDIRKLASNSEGRQDSQSFKSSSQPANWHTFGALEKQLDESMRERVMYREREPQLSRSQTIGLLRPRSAALRSSAARPQQQPPDRRARPHSADTRARKKVPPDTNMPSPEARARNPQAKPAWVAPSTSDIISFSTSNGKGNWTTGDGNPYAKGPRVPYGASVSRIRSEGASVPWFLWFSPSLREGDSTLTRPAVGEKSTGKHPRLNTASKK